MFYKKQFFTYFLAIFVASTLTVESFAMLPEQKDFYTTTQDLHTQLYLSLSQQFMSATLKVSQNNFTLMTKLDRAQTIAHHAFTSTLIEHKHINKEIIVSFFHDIIVTLEQVIYHVQSMSTSTTDLALAYMQLFQKLDFDINEVYNFKNTIVQYNDAFRQTNEEKEIYSQSQFSVSPITPSSPTPSPEPLRTEKRKAHDNSQKVQTLTQKKLKTNNKSHNCSECKKSFTSSSNLNVHMRIHTGENPYKCSQCAATFKYQYKLKKHSMKSHDKAKVALTPSSATIAHQPIKLVPKEVVFGGTLLSENIPSFFEEKEQSISEEVKNVSDKKKHKCNYFRCGKTFPCNSALIKHKRVHTGEKPFACNKCKKRFNQKTNLNTHMKTHSNAKPFVCKNAGCGHSFKVKNSLDLHIRTHTGEQPYQCNICEQKFSQKCNLNTHIKIHNKNLLKQTAKESFPQQLNPIDFFI